MKRQIPAVNRVFIASSISTAFVAAKKKEKRERKREREGGRKRPDKSLPEISSHERR